MKSKRKYTFDNIPIKLFHQVMNSGDFKLVGGEKAWAAIVDDYLRQFGITEEYKQYLEAKIAALEHWARFAEGQRWHRTLARVADAKADKAIAQIKGTGSFDLLVASVSKYMGFRIDTSQVSAKEFYNYLELAKK